MVVEIKIPKLAITDDSGITFELSEGYVKIRPYSNRCRLTQHHTTIIVNMKFKKIMKHMQQNRH
jgi:hypothetical protein